MESWREMYERCLTERDEKLERLKSKISQKASEAKNDLKKVKVCHGNPKAPRTVMRAQAKNGTAQPTGVPIMRNQNAHATRPIPGTSYSPAQAAAKAKPRVAPMMAKTLKLARGLKSGFRR